MASTLFFQSLGDFHGATVEQLVGAFLSMTVTIMTIFPAWALPKLLYICCDCGRSHWVLMILVAFSSLTVLLIGTICVVRCYQLMVTALVLYIFLAT